MQKNSHKKDLRKKFLNWLKNFWPIIVITAVVLIFFYPVWLKGFLPIPADITVGAYYPWLDYKWGYTVGVPVKNPLLSDVVSLLFPWKKIVVDYLYTGMVPLWNMYSFSGMPLLGNFQSAPFSLNNIFFSVFSFNLAWALGVIAQPFFATIAMFIFLKHLRLSNLASLVGGIVFAFSGFSIAWMEYNLHGHVIYWLPFLFLFTDKLTKEKKLIWGILLSLAIAAQIFAGYPQLTIYSLLTTAGFVFFKTITQGLKFKTFVIWLFFVLIGLGLSSIALFPGFETVTLSIRSIDPVAASEDSRFLPWENLITIIAPDFFGNPSTYNFWGQPYYDNFAFYVGIVPLFLALLTIGSRKNALFFQIVVLISLFLALPHSLSKLVAESPLFGIKSIASRSLFLFDFGIAVLAAMGFNQLLKNKRRPFLYLGVLILIVAVIWLFLITGFITYMLGEDAKAYYGVIKSNLILPTALVFGLTIGFLLFRLLPKSLRPLFPLFLLFLVLFDLFRFGWKYLPFSSPNLIFPTTPVINFLQSREKPFRTEFGEVIPENMWIPYGLESAAGYDAVAPMRYNQFLGALDSGKSTNPYGRVAKINNYQSPLFDLLNIKYILAVKYTSKGERSPQGDPKSVFNIAKFRVAFEDRSVMVYENIDSLPRAFLVYNYTKEIDPQRIIDTLSDKSFDPRRSVVLEGDPAFNNRKPTKLGSVSFLEYKNGYARLHTESDTAGILVLLNNYHPGWKAYVDGVETEIYRADFTFQAIKVLEGDREVEFSFKPKSFEIGTIVSILFMGITLFLFLLTRIGATKYN